jgi:hypothetical protein
MRQHLSFEIEQTPWQRLRSLEAIQALKEGRIRAPITCGFCQSTSVQHTMTELKPFEPALRCVTCGRLTTVATAKRLRQQKLRAIIVEGIDPLESQGKDKA